MVFGWKEGGGVVCGMVYTSRAFLPSVVGSRVPELGFHEFLVD